MPTSALTAKNVLALKPRAGNAEENFYDTTKGAPKGFILRVTPGARGFYLRYRFGGKRIWYHLGDAEAPGALADSRDRGHAARSLLQKGIDPRAEDERQRREREIAEREREQQQAATQARPTLAGLVLRFIEGHAEKYKPKTLGLYRTILRAHIEPDPLAAMFASDVRRYQLRAMLEGIVKKTPIMANRTQQLIRGAYAWGIREQLDDALEANPAAGFEIHDERPMPTQERTLSDDEVRQIWLGVDEVNDAGERKLLIETASYIKLLLLCGLRRTEAALAEWPEVRLSADEWLIPAANRKGAGRRGKTAEQRELAVPLVRQSKSILTALRQRTGPQGPVFGRTATAVRTNPHRFMERVREATGVDFSLHDLRATCATGAGDCGAPPHVVSLILGHAALPGAAEATRLYDRARRLKDVREALEAWARRIETIGRTRGAGVTRARA